LFFICFRRSFALFYFHGITSTPRCSVGNRPQGYGSGLSAGLQICNLHVTHKMRSVNAEWGPLREQSIRPTIADARFAFPLGEAGDDVELAALPCAGLIGWRSLVIAGTGKKLGLYGFGAAAHILAQVAKCQGRSVFAFARPGDVTSRSFARRAGATWPGGSDEMPPEPLDAAIILATVGDLVPVALKAVRKGGRVVCAGIRMSDIPSFPYRLLWEERQLMSVANLTRQDGIDFLRLELQIGMVTQTTRYPLSQANQALADLRAGRFEGAAVLVP
jgi:alcohol dehydrogenase, propanol-preferring